MSFGFRVVDEDWPDKRSRELRAVDLVKVSVVSAWPAYEGTSVQARHLLRGAPGLSPAQRRRRGVLATPDCRRPRMPAAVASSEPPPSSVT
jgi:phage head maturation protease